MMCPDELLADLISSQVTDSERELLLEGYINEYPDDYRLFFLLGSSYIETRNLTLAYGHLKKSVELNPNYTLGLFQLGLFELTSGDVHHAFQTWEHLRKTEPIEYISKAVEGFVALVNDNFSHAIKAFQASCANNNSNAPLKANLQLLITELKTIDVLSDHDEPGDLRMSEASLLLKHKSDPSKQ